MKRTSGSYGNTLIGAPISSEVRRSRRLSVSFIATVGNYEYGFYWYFYQDGNIQCEVKLTGIMNTTALLPGEQSPYGVEVAPRLNAGNHQHIFAARLVANVDGPANSVYEVNTVGLPTGPENPHGNAFVAEETLLGTELQARRRVNSNSARFWRIKNLSRTNKLGKPVAYRLIPGENCPPFVQPDAPIMRPRGLHRESLVGDPRTGPKNALPRVIIRINIPPGTACRFGQRRIVRSPKRK